MARLDGVLAGPEEGCGDQGGERGLVAALEHHDGLLAGEGRDDLGLGEGLEQLDRDQARLDALRAQVRQHGAHVVADRAEPDHHDVGVVAVVGEDRCVLAAGELGVLAHRLAHQARDGRREVGPVVDRAGLEVGLVLHRAGQAGVVDVHERGDELAGALLPRVDPLPAPRAVQVLGDPGEGGVDQRAVVVLLDLVGLGGEERPQVGDVAVGDVAAVPGEEAAELEDPALGPEEHLLGDRGARDPARGVAEVLAQQLGLGKQGLAEHVAGGEAVHRVGDRDEGQGGGAVGDRREVRGLLRVGPEEHRVARGQQRVDVVVAGHDVQGVLGHHAGRDLQHEAADLLAHRDVVGLHRVEDPLARRGVRDELAAGQGGAEGTTLGRVLTLGFEEEGVLAPDVEATLGTGGLVDLGDLRRGGDGVADHSPADVAHDVGYGSVAVDHGRDAGVLGGGAHRSVFLAWRRTSRRRVRRVVCGVVRRRKRARQPSAGGVEMGQEALDAELGTLEGQSVAAWGGLRCPPRPESRRSTARRRGPLDLWSSCSWRSPLSWPR